MNLVEILNTVILATFTFGLAVTFYATIRRLLEYRHLGFAPPLLAIRDTVLLLTLTFPFLVILIVRALGLTQFVAGQWWWSLITGIPPIVGVLQFAYIEFFVIERRDSRGYLKYLQQAIEDKELRLNEEIEARNLREDKEFGDKRRELELEHTEIERVENGISEK